MLERQFSRLQRLVECVPICRLTYPRDFSHLEAVAGAITDDLRSGGKANVQARPGVLNSDRTTRCIN
jgi:hypothetical protein